MADPKNAERDRARRDALKRLRGWTEPPQTGLAEEAEASLLSAFALADLLNGLRGR